MQSNLKGICKTCSTSSWEVAVLGFNTNLHLQMRFCPLLSILSVRQCSFPHSKLNESVCSLAGKHKRLKQGQMKQQQYKAECLFLDFLFFPLLCSSFLSCFFPWYFTFLSPCRPRDQIPPGHLPLPGQPLSDHADRGRTSCDVLLTFSEMVKPILACKRPQSQKTENESCQICPPFPQQAVLLTGM